MIILVKNMIKILRIIVVVDVNLILLMIIVHVTNIIRLKIGDNMMPEPTFNTLILVVYIGIAF